MATAKEFFGGMLIVGLVWIVLFVISLFFPQCWINSGNWFSLDCMWPFLIQVLTPLAILFSIVGTAGYIASERYGYGDGREIFYTYSVLP